MLRTPSGTESSVVADPNVVSEGFVARNPQSSASAAEHALGLKRITVTIDAELVRISDTAWISLSRNPLPREMFNGELFVVDMTCLPESTEVVEGPGLIESAQELGANERWLRSQIQGTEGFPPETEVLVRGQVPAEAITSFNDLPRETVQAPPPAMPTEGVAGWIGRHGSNVTRGLTGVGIAVTTIRLSAAREESYETGSVRPIAAEAIRQAGAWGGSYLGGRFGMMAGSLLGGGSGLSGGAAAPATVPSGAVVGAFVGGISFSLFGGWVGFETADIIADMIHRD